MLGGGADYPQIVDWAEKKLVDWFYWLLSKHCRFQPNFAYILQIVDFRMDCRLQTKVRNCCRIYNQANPPSPPPCQDVMKIEIFITFTLPLRGVASMYRLGSKDPQFFLRLVLSDKNTVSCFHFFQDMINTLYQLQLQLQTL